MNYTLAKRLKDVGYPQGEPRDLYCLDCKKWRDIDCFNNKHNKEAVVVPTLEELIEACGEEFGTLEYNYEFYGKNGVIKGSGLQWCAFNPERTIMETSLSPEISVANLYLSLKELKKGKL